MGSGRGAGTAADAKQQVLTGELLAAIEEHRIAPLMYTFCGQGVSYFRELQTVAEIVTRLETEADAALARLPR